MESILEARGIFWLNSQPVPDGRYAPEESTYGTLTIKANGQASLDLDGHLSSTERLASIFNQGESLPEGMFIQGLLKGQNEHVLLSGLRRDGGGFASGGMSYERYLALNCLVGSGLFPHGNELPKFHRLIVNLRGFENWTNLRSIATKKIGNGLAIRYMPPKNSKFTIKDSKISVRHHIKAPLVGKGTVSKSDKIEIEEYTEVVYKPNRKASLQELKKIYLLIGDLLILLANTAFPLEWPVISIEKAGKKSNYKLYFWRNSPEVAPLEWRDCWVMMQSIQDFGKIFSNWMDKRELYGPGYYLYLGTRRGQALYAEHLFVNLIWGIEALHRKTSAENKSASKTKARVARIVSELSQARDKKWLEGRLAHVHEPNLEQRIFETFDKLPINFFEGDLRKFAGLCAKRRNDISHFGGQRDGIGYSEFLEEISIKSQAISYLLHAYILHDIGIPVDAILFNFLQGPNSYGMRKVLESSGLRLMGPLANSIDLYSDSTLSVDN